MLPKFRNAHYGTYGIRERAVEFAKRRAQRLLKESQITTPPILPEYLAPAQGIKKIIKEDLGNLSGLLLPLREGFVIKINATHSPQRQNFSCAHEIGHTFFFEEEGISLIKGIKTETGDKVGNNLLEYLCDISAAELLMPALTFSKYAVKYNFHISALSPLSNIFNTSIDATSIRLCDFISKPCYVARLALDKSQELDDLKLRPTWLTWSKRQMTTRSSRLLLNPKLLGQKTGMLKALRTDQPVYSREWMGVVNFRGYCQIWSQGFRSGSQRFVISFIFPECDN